MNGMILVFLIVTVERSAASNYADVSVAGKPIMGVSATFHTWSVKSQAEFSRSRDHGYIGITIYKPDAEDLSKVLLASELELTISSSSEDKWENKPIKDYKSARIGEFTEKKVNGGHFSLTFKKVTFTE